MMSDDNKSISIEILKELKAIQIEQARFETEVELMKKNLANSLRSGVNVESFKDNINEPLVVYKKKRTLGQKLTDFWNRIKIAGGWI